MSQPHTCLGFPCGSAGKESTGNSRDLGLIPGLGRSPGEGKGYPLQYSGLENSMDFSPRGRKESDTTEQLSLSPHQSCTLNCSASERLQIPFLRLPTLMGRIGEQRGGNGSKF